jgi:prepilin-type N-terminal cleavage/methylation domain-containing protein
MWRVTSDEQNRPGRGAHSCHSSLITHHSFAFTLIELLVVITILGILAGLAVPALKNLGKSNLNLSASRQLLDDVAHARQLAVSQRTTVYMVFVPTNFWVVNGSSSGPWLNSLTPAQKTAVTNLLDKQLTGYTFISYGALGDQPGQHLWHYLAPWQNLPSGAFIAQQKFTLSGGSYSYAVTNFVTGAAYTINGFSTTNNIPFPTADPNMVADTGQRISPWLPYVAFNYLGQLVSGHDEYIPLAQGSLSYAINGNKALQLASAAVSETPPGNSTNSAFNLVHIDALTGRAVLEYQKAQ